MVSVNTFRLENFCCKYDLKCGTLVIGGLTSFVSICYFLFAFVSAVTGEASSEHYKVAIPATLSSLIIHCLIFYGAIRESSVCLLPFLVITGSILVVICYLALILAVLEPLVLIAFIFMAPAIYCWLTVHSYYRFLTTDNITITNPSMVAYNDPISMEATKYPEVV